MEYKDQNGTENKNRKSGESPYSYPPSYPPYPNGLYMEEEINLIDYWRVLMKRKRMIISFIFVAIIASVIYSLMKPNIYRTEVVLFPVEDKENGGGVGALLGQFSGLASFAGISLGGSSSEVNLAVLKSRTFLKKIVQEI